MYIDPNSGGLIFQVLLIMFGVISGAVLIFSSKIKMGVSKIRRSLREKYGKHGQSHPNPDDNNN
jgi:uncharacterized YccA/Bax inhibitor family protein